MKKVYATFGRLNPPTIGHEKLLKAVQSKAGSDDWWIVVSQSVKPKTDPLPYQTKVEYLKKMFPQHSGKIISGPRDPVAIMQDLMMRGYDEVHFLVGSDRVNAMQWIHKYNGDEYSFRKLDIVSSGSRDADGDTFAVSGTKMRRAAFAGDFKTFRSGIPTSLKENDCRMLMMEVAANLPANYK